MKTKLTKQEKNWILYDVGNSAFTLLAATILPVSYTHLGIEGDYNTIVGLPLARVYQEMKEYIY